MLGHETPVFIARRHASFIRHDSDLEEEEHEFFIASVVLALQDARASAHALHVVTGFDNTRVTLAVLMVEHSEEDVGKYFHIPEIVGWGSLG